MERGTVVRPTRSYRTWRSSQVEWGRVPVPFQDAVRTGCGRAVTVGGGCAAGRACWVAGVERGHLVGADSSTELRN